MNLVPYSYNGTQINDGTNYKYTKIMGVGGLLPAHSSVKYTQRGIGQYPAISGKELQGGSITISIVVLPAGNLQTLKALFDTSDSSTHQFIAIDADDSNRRWYVDATPVDVMGDKDDLLKIVLALRDPIWKQVTAETETTWTLTASAQTQAFTIDKGNLDAYPVYSITPNAAPTSFFAHRRWVPVYNPSTSIAYQPGYMINACQSAAGTHVLNTATLVSGGKMQSDGDDFRAYISGTHVHSWHDGINGASTKLWVETPGLRPSIEGALQSAIAGTGDVTQIVLLNVVNAGRLPDQDEYLIYIDSELFRAETAYRRIIDGQRAVVFEDIDRAQNDTSMAAHSAAATGRVLEWELWVYYGNSSLTTPFYRNTSNDHYKGRPMFDMTSSTAFSWVWANFRDSENLRAHRWRPGGNLGMRGTGAYTANRGTYANPASEIGLRQRAAQAQVFWEFAHPAITAIAFANGEKYNLILRNVATGYRGGQVMYRDAGGEWQQLYAVPATTAADTWQSWSYTSGTIAAKAVRMTLENNVANPLKKMALLEAADATATLDSALVPVVRLQAEVSQSFTFDGAKLENTTTGEYIEINGVMDVGDTLVIDTLNKTVKIGRKNAFAYIAGGISSVRATWLRMQQGSNTLKYTQAGITDVDIDIAWRGRNN